MDVKKTILLLLPFIFILHACLFAQVYTREDSLRETLTPLRTCYDVRFYDLNVSIDPATRTVRGYNAITFEAVSDFRKMQIDLARNLAVEQITLDNRKLPFERALDAIFVELPRVVEKGKVLTLKVYYGGKPIVAVKPPWEGGVVWSEDSLGNPWIASCVQSIGAMQWWPNKEHQSDEPDSMMIRMRVPQGLQCIANGRFMGVEKADQGWVTWAWHVSYPINNYCVSFNIGKFAHFDDVYINKAGDTLSLHYYVLPYNLAKAKKQFRQVKSMLTCFEDRFGKYPFYMDGYKLIEAPYWGMEHQTAVTYGNEYKNGKKGVSSSRWGLDFDFIIIHESGHEWWGNNITVRDIADMWVHEAFTTYAEALYVEYYHGYEAGLDYVNSLKQLVLNDAPIVGDYGVNHEGSRDMYFKGALMLNTIRHIIDNDTLWFSILKGLQQEFGLKTVTGNEIIAYINEKSGKDLCPVFDYYLKQTDIPVLEVHLSYAPSGRKIAYQWKSEMDDFSMPLTLRDEQGSLIDITPVSNRLQFIDPAHLDFENFKAVEDKYYIRVEKFTQYAE